MNVLKTLGEKLNVTSGFVDSGLARIFVVAGIALAPLSANAATIFSDDFNGNPTGYDVTPTGWEVVDGTVDVVGPNVYPELCIGGIAGGNVCVDLDGTSFDAGVLRKSFSLTSGATYTVSFDLAGNQRAYETGLGGPDFVTVRFGSALLELSNLSSDTEWARYSLSFMPTASGEYQLSFSNAGGDNVGAVIDNVRVDEIPIPGTIALLGLGMLGIGAARRKQA